MDDKKVLKLAKKQISKKVFFAKHCSGNMFEVREDQGDGIKIYYINLYDEIGKRYNTGDFEIVATKKELVK